MAPSMYLASLTLYLSPSFVSIISTSSDDSRELFVSVTVITPSLSSDTDSKTFGSSFFPVPTVAPPTRELSKRAAP